MIDIKENISIYRVLENSPYKRLFLTFLRQVFGMLLDAVPLNVCQDMRFPRRSTVDKGAI